jgi:diguanylate cyclase (GGDEF)-like protein
MSLSEAGRALKARLLTQKTETSQAALAEEEKAALRQPAGDYNAMAPMTRLAPVLEKGVEVFGRACLDAAIEAFEAEGAELTELDARELGAELTEIIKTRARSAQSAMDYRALVAGVQASPFAQVFARAEASATQRLTNELEIYRLKKQLRTAPSRTSQRRAWLQELPDEIDALLPIASHRAFKKDLVQALSETTITEPLSLVRTDVDHFKDVNDKHGHPAGDVTLRTVAQIHQTVTSGKGKAYRVGGEEMALLLPNTTESEAAATAERLRAAVENEVIPEIERAVTLSAGVACADEPSTTSQHLDESADQALYRAKEGGRNQVVTHSSAARSPGATPPPKMAPALPKACPPGIPPAIFTTIRAKCQKEWPDNFEMQLYCETKQFEAYRKLHPGT